MTKLSKEDKKWLLWNQKMGAMSGRKKITADKMWELLQEAYDEVYKEDKK